MNKYTWGIWVITIGMGILSFMYGCATPESEMDEHWLAECVLTSDGGAFCR